MSHHGHPLALLRDIEQRSLRNTRGLPQRAESRALWHGIGFRIGDITLVAPLTQVNEILHYPKLTLVPGTLSWVKGLANIRGTLLPVMDLRGYLGQSAVSLDAHSRIMVIQQENLSAGLLVDEVLGLKHFDPQEAVTRVKKLNEAVRPYIQGAFLQAGQTWYVFNMATLAEDPQFLQVAV
ncbi:MAG TPA: purine-binding chemotaxis protein CheW [Gammaproteobacteria bacterium]|nr:purine-binding chemotaxis protein CheW [Gammaproteobacteria bacterium]